MKLIPTRYNTVLVLRILLCATLFGLASSSRSSLLAAPDVAKRAVDAKPGAVFDRRLESHETQSVIEHWTGKERLARRSTLEASVRFKLVSAGPRKVVLRGEVLEGRFQLTVRGFLELEEVYGLFFDTLRFELTIEPKKTRLQLDRKTWAGVRKRFDEVQKRRALPAGIAKEVRDGLLRQLERAQVVSFWPLLRGRDGRGRDERGGVRSSLKLPLWRKGAKGSGEIRLEPYPDLARFFSDTDGQEIPLRRTHRPRDSEVDAAVGFGTLAWKVGPEGVPAASRLEAYGDYDDQRELAELVDRPQEYRQYHSVDIWLGPSDEAMPDLGELTGLPPFLPVPNVVSLLEGKKEKRVFEEYVERAFRGGGELIDVLEDYARLERVRKTPPRLRAAIHFALAEEVALAAFGRKIADVEQAVGLILRESKEVPLVVLVLRAVAHPFAKLSAGDRSRYCRTVLSRSEPELAIQGARFLSSLSSGTADAQRSAKALIEALATETAKGRGASKELVRALRFDLARLAGTKTLRLKIGDLRSHVDELELELEPRNRPLTLDGKIVDQTIPTFFEEAIAGPTVFLLDNSMEIVRGARSQPSAQVAVRPDRLEWARAPLLRTFQNMRVGQDFGIIRFHSRAWKFAPTVRRADPDSTRKALLFLGRADIIEFKDRGSVRRARYDTGFRAAFEDPKMETLVLLTDGQRGDDWKFEADLLVANYLRGVRIVTYGHGGAAPGAREPLRFLERIAYLHHGWCRFVR